MANSLVRPISVEQETLHRELIRAWENYQATGLHVTEKEAEKWIDSWGTENELPVPECHS
jgi:predicted transcriptional regulator